MRVLDLHTGLAVEGPVKRSPERVLWVDPERPTPEELSALPLKSPLNPLATEDAWSPGHRPKVEDYGDHLFIIYRALTRPEACDPATNRVSIFWFEDTLVTIRSERVSVLERVWTEVSAPTRGSSPGHVVYLLLDGMTDTYFPIVDAVRQQVDDLEEAVLDGKSGGVGAAKDVFRLKHVIAEIRQITSTQREIAGGLARRDHDFVSSPARLAAARGGRPASGPLADAGTTRPQKSAGLRRIAWRRRPAAVPRRSHRGAPAWSSPAAPGRSAGRAGRFRRLPRGGSRRRVVLDP
jgi:Mg2+ and Co2+ transporter CorA